MTETLIVSRGATDKYAERTDIGTHSIQGVFAWRSGFTDKANDRAESATTTASLYVPRGTDVQARDRVTRSNGERYAVVGHALWEQNQPQTGHDFGWMVFQVQSV